MKVTLTMKWPDHELSDPVRAAKDLLGVEDEEDGGDAFQEIVDKIEAATDKFLKYNEYITVEIDLDTQTATVLEAK